MTAVGLVIIYVLYAFIGLLFVRFIVDWVQLFARSWQPKGVVLVILESVYSVTDPPIVALRRVLKPVRFGGIALDLSFLIVLLLCYLLVYLTEWIFFG